MDYSLLLLVLKVMLKWLVKGILGMFDSKERGVGRFFGKEERKNGQKCKKIFFKKSIKKIEKRKKYILLAKCETMVDILFFV